LYQRLRHLCNFLKAKKLVFDSGSDDLPYNCMITPIMPRVMKKLRIRLISGHHLPKSADSRKLRDTVIRPYVKLKLNGHPIDEHEHITKTVPKVL